MAADICKAHAHIQRRLRVPAERLGTAGRQHADVNVSERKLQGGGGCWEANEGSYSRVQQAVINDVNNDARLGLPTLNSTAPVVFVCVGGIPGEK